MVDDPNPPVPMTPADPPPADPPAPAAPPADELAELKRQNQEYLDRLRQGEESQKALEERLKKLETPAPLPLSVKDQQEKFYADPIGATREVVRAELQATVAPLVEFVNEFKGSNSYTALKARFRNNPKFKPYFDQYEEYIDRAMVSVNPPTERALLATISSLAGAISLGLIDGAPAPTPPGDPVPPTPSHIRPSPPPPPKPPAPKPRQISEEQRRLMRENNMTEDEYFQHYDSERLSVSPEEIVAGKGGKK